MKAVRRVRDARHPTAIGLAALLSFGCSGESIDTADNAGTAGAGADSPSALIVENDSPTWETPWRIGASPAAVVGDETKGAGHQLYGEVKAVSLPNGDLLVAVGGLLGNSELRLFDSTGAYFATVGRTGEGPGELQSMSGPFQLGPGDSVFVFDFDLVRVSVFDPSGVFARSFLIAPQGGAARPGFHGTFGDGTLLFDDSWGTRVPVTGPARVEERERKTLFRFHPATDVWDTVASYRGREYYIAPDPRRGFIRRHREFGTYAAIAASGSRFYVGDNESYEIKQFSSDGVLERVIRRALEPETVPDSEVALLREHMLAGAANELVRRFLERGFAGHPTRRTFPAFNPFLLLVDGDANLWVQEYPRPSDANQRWTVFDSTGVMLGTVDMPEGIGLAFAGTNHILGIHRDEIGVQRVLRYHLLKGPERASTVELR